MSLSCENFLNPTVGYKTHCRLGGYAHPGAGADYSWGTHETFSKDNWEYETFWRILRVIDTEMLKSQCTSCKFADTFSVNSHFNSNFGMKSCDWAREM